MALSCRNLSDLRAEVAGVRLEIRAVKMVTGIRRSGGIRFTRNGAV